MAVFHSEKHNVTYYALPKTASQAVKHIMTTHYGAKQVRGKQALNIPKGSYVFTVARNPYSRCVSLWWSTCKDADDRYGFKEYGETPEKLLKWLVEGGPAYSIPNYRNLDLCWTQDHWLGMVKPDKIIDYNDLDEGLKGLPCYNGEFDRVPIVNRKDRDWRKSLSEYMTPTFIELVNEWCHDDFVRFGYTKELP